MWVVEVFLIFKCFPATLAFWPLPLYYIWFLIIDMVPGYAWYGTNHCHWLGHIFSLESEHCKPAIIIIHTYKPLIKFRPMVWITCIHGMNPFSLSNVPSSRMAECSQRQLSNENTVWKGLIGGLCERECILFLNHIRICKISHSIPFALLCVSRPIKQPWISWFLWHFWQ